MLTRAHGGSHPADPGTDAAPRVTAENEKGARPAPGRRPNTFCSVGKMRGTAPRPGSRPQAPGAASPAGAPSRCSVNVCLLSDGVISRGPKDLTGLRPRERKRGCRLHSHRLPARAAGTPGGIWSRGWGRGARPPPDTARRFPHTGTCSHYLGRPVHRVMRVQPPRESD